MAGRLISGDKDRTAYFEWRCYSSSGPPAFKFLIGIYKCKRETAEVEI
jgi:hypothetical protein